MRQHIDDLLAELPPTEDLDEQDDPVNADLIWWKDGAYVLVEISRIVDETEVQRAYARARTLQRAGAAKGVHSVLPVVFGQTWDQRTVKVQDREVSIRGLAEHLGVAWWVGDDLCPEVIEYRRLTPGR